MSESSGDWETADLEEQVFYSGFLADLVSAEELREVLAMILVGKGIGVDTREMVAIDAFVDVLYPEIDDLAAVRCDYEEECDFCRGDEEQYVVEEEADDTDGVVVVASEA